MNLIEIYFGFYPRWSDPRGWFGHCEAWGYTEQDTWLFLDPQSSRFCVTVEHRHDEVMDHLAARFELCETILKMRPDPLRKVIPLHGPMTCASICGHLVGIRALFPATLKRKLLRNGAEVVHGQAKGRSRGQEGAAA